LTGHSARGAVFSAPVGGTAFFEVVSAKNIFDLYKPLDRVLMSTLDRERPKAPATVGGGYRNRAQTAFYGTAQN
jgi:hypothetical protein